jgi:hypothetical protein
MSDWPTEPLIRIDRGTLDGESIDGVLAGNGHYDLYTILSGKERGGILAEACTRDSIEEWTPLTAVPTFSIEALRQAFLGAILSSSQHRAIHGITSCAPPPKMSLVRRAIVAAKKLPTTTARPLQGNNLKRALLRESATPLPEFAWGDYVRIAAVAAEAVKGLGDYDAWDALAECANDVPECGGSSEEYEGLVAAIGRALTRSDLNSFIEVGGRALAYAAQSARRGAA